MFYRDIHSVFQLHVFFVFNIVAVLTVYASWKNFIGDQTQGACQFLFDDVLCITKNLRKTSVCCTHQVYELASWSLNGRDQILDIATAFFCWVNSLWGAISKFDVRKKKKKSESFNASIILVLQSTVRGTHVMRVTLDCWVGFKVLMLIAVIALPELTLYWPQWTLLT